MDSLNQSLKTHIYFIKMERESFRIYNPSHYRPHAIIEPERMKGGELAIVKVAGQHVIMIPPLRHLLAKPYICLSCHVLHSQSHAKPPSPHTVYKIWLPSNWETDTVDLCRPERGRTKRERNSRKKR